MTIKTIATGLRFPEGPVAMPDGSVLLVEIARQTISRITPDGAVTIAAQLAGGPNGLAIGPDGAAYVCNNGGARWLERNGNLFPTLPADDYEGGRIERVDLSSGEVTVLYTHCGEHRLTAPNDLQFDAFGGFWFSDHGKTKRRTRDRGGVYYAKADGSLIREAVFPIDSPNGIGLSPDGKALYVAETHSARLWSFEITAPGVINPKRTIPVERGRFLFNAGGQRAFDSLGMEACGNVCLATMVDNPGICVVSPEGELVEFVAMDDAFPTNICFGGPDLSTAYITLSGSGRLVEMPWKRPGMPLPNLNEGGMPRA